MSPAATPDAPLPAPCIPMRVAATGICCSVGNDTASVSAAIRANMAHFRPGRFRDRAGEPINLAMLDGISFWGQDRLQHMYRAAMIECLGKLPSLEQEKLLPPIILIGAERERGIRFQHHIRDLLLNSQPEEGYDPRTVLGCLGKAGIAQALRGASAMFAAANPPQYVVIVAVDSFLEADSIQQYLVEERLVCSENQDGFIPGEAAAAVALSAAPSAEPALWIEGVGSAYEQATPLNQDTPLRAIGLTRAMRNALTDANWRGEDVRFHASAISGEQWFFKEASLAMDRVLTTRVERLPHRVVAESVGEIGAAFGPLMLAWIGDEMTPSHLGNKGLLHFANDNGLRAALAVHYH